MTHPLDLVVEFRHKMELPLPTTPTVPSEDERSLLVTLLNEEAIELSEAVLAFQYYSDWYYQEYSGHVVEELFDTYYVTLGIALAYGALGSDYTRWSLPNESGHWNCAPRIPMEAALFGVLISLANEIRCVQTAPDFIVYLCSVYESLVVHVCELLQLPAVRLFDALHTSNMAKAGGPRREDGKVLKLVGREPTNFETILREEGYFV